MKKDLIKNRFKENISHRVSMDNIAFTVKRWNIYRVDFFKKNIKKVQIVLHLTVLFYYQNTHELRNLDPPTLAQVLLIISINIWLQHNFICE